jgi:hypothetical protein
MSKRNCFVSAPKVANELHLTSGVRISDQSEVQVVTECQSTRSETSCYNTVDSTLLSNSYCLSNHPSALDSKTMKYNFVYWWDLFSCGFANGCARVWRGRIEWFYPKNVSNRYGGGSVMVWGGITHYGKTNLVTINGTLNLQPYCEGIMFSEVVPFLNQGQVTIYFNNIMLGCTPQDRSKTFYARTISMYWNRPQGCLIYHHLSICGTFLINVW